MERIRNFGSFLYDFGRSVVEWRSPATAPYLMAINTAFWGASLYCEQLVQIRLLISLAAGIFGWDVLLSPTHDRSIALHVLFWPVQSIWRTLGVTLSLYSAHVLRLGELEAAFWSAYATVACLLVNPVWDYYETNEKIYRAAAYSLQKTKEAGDAAIVRPVCAIGRGIKYVVCLEFIPPMWAAIKHAFASTGGGIRGFFKAIWSLICKSCAAVRDWWKYSVVQPIWNGMCAVGRWLRYWFCAHWWPDLKEWLKIKVGRPLRRLFDYICYWLVYIFCGHWVKPLSRFLLRHLKRFAAFVHQTVIVPIKLWLLARLHELSVFVKRQLHRLALAIRDSVLWPICLLIADCAKQIYAIIHRTLIQPVLDYLYVRYKIIEDAVLIYFLGPVCEKVINNIPEKSPFCDDSDVELEGLLPEEEGADAEEVMAEQASAMADNEIESMDEDMIPPSPLDEEEHDFVAGLAFPTIHASESSDDEFDLRHNRSRPPVRRRKKEAPPPEVDSDGESRMTMSQKKQAEEIHEDDLIPITKPSDPDDHFELLG